MHFNSVIHLLILGYYDYVLITMDKIMIKDLQILYIIYQKSCNIQLSTDQSQL